MTRDCAISKVINVYLSFLSLLVFVPYIRVPVYWASLSGFKIVKLLIYRRRIYTHIASAEGVSEIFIDMYRS